MHDIYVFLHLSQKGNIFFANKTTFLQSRPNGAPILSLIRNKSKHKMQKMCAFLLEHLWSKCARNALDNL